MSFFGQISAGLRHYRLKHIAIFIVVSLLSCMIAGALGTGRILQSSLKSINSAKCASVESIIVSKKVLFGSENCPRPDNATSSPILLLDATAAFTDNSGTAHSKGIKVLGVDRSFSDFSPDISFSKESESETVFINTRLSEALGAKDGDEIVIRVLKADMPPLDSPFVAKSNLFAQMRRKVTLLAPGKSMMADFSLDASSSEALNAFLPLNVLSSEIAVPNRANILLMKDLHKEISSDKVLHDFFSKLAIEDLQLSLGETEGGRMIVLKSEKVFIDPDIENAATEARSPNFRTLSYLANSISGKGSSAPYSFVCGSDYPPLKAMITSKDCAISSEWLAERLQISPGDKVSVSYYSLQNDSALIEKNADFKLAGTIPMIFPYTSKIFSPGLSSLENVENCSDWDPSLPIDLKKITPADEDYWDKYRSAPKLFISLDKAKELWANKFGALTSLAYEFENNGAVPSAGEISARIAEIKSSIMKKLSPQKCGFEFIPLREMLSKSSIPASDFSQIFAGMSFFAVASAIFLVYILASSAMLERKKDACVLLSLGFSQSFTRRILIAEHMIPALSGAFCGALAYPLYSVLIISFISRFFHPDSRYLKLDFSFSDIAASFLISALASAISLYISCASISGTRIANLAKSTSCDGQKYRKGSRLLTAIGLCIMGVSFAPLLLVKTSDGESSAAVFFLSGFLFMLSLFFILSAASRYISSSPFKNFSLFKLSLRDLASGGLSTIFVVFSFAASFFLVLSVGANRTDPRLGAKSGEAVRNFGLCVETSIPLAEDLNSPATRKRLGLPPDPNLFFLPIKTGPGEDADCLNLCKTSKPKIIGVDNDILAKMGAFSFSSTIDEKSAPEGDSPWKLLDQKFPDGAIPAFFDENALRWILAGKIGDSFSYLDEKGETVRIRIAGAMKSSVLQGKMIIGKKYFNEIFPSYQGSKMILAKCPFESRDKVAASLAYSLFDFGASVSKSEDVLAKFAAVENTYLDIFLFLGALGLLLASLATAVFTWREILKKQKEHAIMESLGFTRRSIVFLALSGQIIILFSGLLIGALSSAIALAPVSWTPGKALPLKEIAAIVFCLISVSILSMLFSLLSVARKNCVTLLRSE